MIAISGDDEKRATRVRVDWELRALPIGHGLTEDAMHESGLYVSETVKEEGLARFNEPGLFLIAADGTISYVAVNGMPFGRPKLADILDAVDFVSEDTYPARGEAARRTVAATGWPDLPRSSASRLGQSSAAPASETGGFWRV